ncbi:type IV secretion system DNA-binding domain-containing protein [Patescibacteria group bacterium]|nr:type IV secretion system DNA-binding domain-containing protein [Patescibacteria group bacterium]
MSEFKIRKFKLASPPMELPVYGKVNSKDCSFFGRTNYEAAFEEKKFIFGIKRADRRRHIYVIGKSGTGKSKLLELLIRQDIAHGYGVCLIDPHGDLIENILDFIPENRVDDVVLIDPSDINWPVSFNPLKNVSIELKHQVAQELIEVLKKQFGANWTPRLEHVFRFTCLALLDYPRATMRGMILMLTDRNYRQKVVNYIEDDMVKRFWAIEFSDWSAKFDSEAIIPLVNKLGQFLSNPLLRNIFGQEENKIDLVEIMNSQKILLINLAKGKLGEENSSFFGSMFVTKIYQTGMARATIKEEERKDFYLYVDEFHNLITTTFENLLTESRKYGLCVTVAHQYMAQLLPEVSATVLGNIGTIIVFRISGDDAVKLTSEMAPIFRAEDMINLGTREFFIKMAIEGEVFDPFSAETLAILPATQSSYRKEIIEQSRRKYSLSLAEVKQAEEKAKETEMREANRTEQEKQIEQEAKGEAREDPAAPLL